MGAAHALAELIDAVEKANGWSDEDVARTARARGHQLTKQNISRVRNEPVTTLVPKQLRALADGLQLPTRQVVQAALRSADLAPGEPALSVDEAIRSDPTLSGHDRRVLLAALKAMRETDDATPMNDTRTPEEQATDADMDSALDDVAKKRKRRGRD